MGKPKLSRLARSDLNEIYDYIATHDPKAALRQIKRLEEAITRLGEMPYAGSLFELLPEKEYRFVTVGFYVIIYTVISEFVIVLRIVHGRRDLQSLVFE